MSYMEMARRIWSCGEPLPVDLAMRLLDLDYDIEALEEKYMHGNNAYTSAFETTEDE